MAKEKKKRTISAKGCRAKGHGFEREVAQALRKVFPEARRQLEYHSADAKGVDIMNTGEYLFQCKRNRKYASLSALKEIQICPIEGGTPVLVTKGDGLEPMACLPFSKFLALIRKEAIANRIKER